jgi:hypothetical protein
MWLQKGASFPALCSSAQAVSIWEAGVKAGIERGLKMRGSMRASRCRCALVLATEERARGL